MSNMLDQVIVDAEALKEVAIKNAEAAIVEKYSDDIKKAVNQLLEQGPPPEDMAMMAGAMAPAPPGTPGAPGGMDAGSDLAVPEAQLDTQKTVTLNLSELVQEMQMGDLDPSEKQVRELVAEEVTGGEEITPEGGEEMITISESVIAEILGETLNEDDFNEEELEEQAPVVGQSRPATPEELSRRLPGSAEGHAHGQSMPERDTIGGFTPLRPDTQGVKGETAIGRQTEPDPERPAQSLPGQPVPRGTKIAGVGGKPKYRGEVTRRQAQTGGVVGDVTPFGTEVMDIPSTGDVHEGLKRDLQAYQHNYAKLYESHKAYEQHYAQLHQEAQALHEQNNKFREILVKAQEKLNEVNVRNAQLHYTNRTLISDSLNERQKDKVVEAIEKAGTVEEAKIIFETLQSAVAGAKPNNEAPKSLNEAINKRSSAFLPRKEEKQSDPSFADRMQRLAGIK
jgi:hypothetical protein